MTDCVLSSFKRRRAVRSASARSLKRPTLTRNTPGTELSRNAGYPLVLRRCTHSAAASRLFRAEIWMTQAPGAPDVGTFGPASGAGDGFGCFVAAAGGAGSTTRAAGGGGCGFGSVFGVSPLTSAG